MLGPSVCVANWKPIRVGNSHIITQFSPRCFNEGVSESEAFALKHWRPKALPYRSFSPDVLRLPPCPSTLLISAIFTATVLVWSHGALSAAAFDPALPIHAGCGFSASATRRHISG